MTGVFLHELPTDEKVQTQAPALVDPEQWKKKQLYREDGFTPAQQGEASIPHRQPSVLLRATTT